MKIIGTDCTGCRKAALRLPNDSVIRNPRNEVFLVSFASAKVIMQCEKYHLDWHNVP
jgi:hypothetical protein